MERVKTPPKEGLIIMWRTLPVLICAGFVLLTGCQSGAKQELSSTTSHQTYTSETPSKSKEIQTVSNTTSENDSNAEWVTTQSGLKYRVLREGNGTFPTKDDTVEVHYKGWLDNGNEFDSSYKRNDTTSFPLSGVIPGWTEGITYVSEGGEIELEISPELGYGVQGYPPVIPGNSTLHFTVELVKVQ